MNIIKCQNEKLETFNIDTQPTQSFGALQEHSKQLIKICEASVQLSGRTLRKIPFLAYALFLNGTKTPDLRNFLVAMNKAVEKEHQQRKDFKTKK